VKLKIQDTRYQVWVVVMVVGDKINMSDQSEKINE
jgi:hypothetical protein